MSRTLYHLWTDKTSGVITFNQEAATLFASDGSAVTSCQWPCPCCCNVLESDVDDADGSILVWVKNRLREPARSEASP